MSGVWLALHHTYCHRSARAWPCRVRCPWMWLAQRSASPSSGSLPLSCGASEVGRMCKCGWCGFACHCCCLHLQAFVVGQAPVGIWDMCGDASGAAELVALTDCRCLCWSACGDAGGAVWCLVIIVVFICKHPGCMWGCGWRSTSPHHLHLLVFVHLWASRMCEGIRVVQRFLSLSQTVGVHVGACVGMWVAQCSALSLCSSVG